MSSIQFTGLNFDDIEEFVGGDYGKDEDGDAVVATPEGALRIEPGCWIIKGYDGTFYTLPIPEKKS